MNLSGRDQVKADTVNVVQLFGRMNPEIMTHDPLSELIKEGELLDELVVASEVKPRKIVSENQFPDQSIYILEEQLSGLRSSFNRIKFYLGDLEDLIPR